MALDEQDASHVPPFPSLGTRALDSTRNRRLRTTRASSRSPHRRATCSVMAHWGEVIQGPVMIDGRPQIGLVTLPDPSHYVTASAAPSGNGGGISCRPSSKAKALQAAQLVIEKWSPGLGVELTFRSTIPEGVGAGSSTADCTATVYAIREMLGVPPAQASEHDLLADVFAAEGPCDPLILLDGDTTLLWGSRSGTLLKSYDAPLPPFLALGFVTDPGRTVSTVELADEQARHPATAHEIDAFAAVLRAFEQALAAQSGAGVARAAMASGSLNQSRCPIDGWDELIGLYDAVGALGVSCAHSGTAAAFLFDPTSHDLEERLDRATAELQRLQAAHIHRFRTDSMPLFWAGPHEMTIEP
jgi:uncharacterized protein involved in propanediol utilization